MANTKQETTAKPTVTRAEKKDATKKLIKEVLAKSQRKSNDLIDEAAKLYAAQFGGEDAENPNDVKGRIGSVLDVMKKDGEVLFDGGVYALKEEEKLKKAKKTTKKAAAEVATQNEVKEDVKEESKEEKPKAKRTAKKKIEPLPAAPLQPIAPVAPITPETAPEPIPESAPKKRGRKAKAEEVKKETEVKAVEIKEEEVKVETPVLTVEESKTEMVEQAEAVAPAQPVVMDMSFLFGEVKPTKKEEPKPETKEETKAEPKAEPKAVVKEEPKAENKPTAKETKPAQAKKPQPKTAAKPPVSNRARITNKPKTADEKLQEAFLNRLHRLGGDYFEYYSVYLLEKYSRRNGRRLEALKISGGDHDGGIDGEIELTDRLGFRETIYIQAKNWDPDKGDERLWTVGETLLQQFIGACVCRQAKEGKQHCRGILITTSRFTPEAKRMLEDTSDKFIGYDGADLYETAKECEFGIIKKNGEWVLDENLLSGEKALFTVF